MRKRYRLFFSSALIILANEIVNARPVVFAVLLLGICVWTVENVLKTLRLSVIYFEDPETKR